MSLVLPTWHTRTGGSADSSRHIWYADPPFATGERQRLASIRTGAGERTRRGFGGREYRYEVVRDLAFDDGLPLDDHLAALEARVREIHRVLADHGSLYLHVDWRTSHHVRLLLDDVFSELDPERRAHLVRRIASVRPVLSITGCQERWLLVRKFTV